MTKEQAMRAVILAFGCDAYDKNSTSPTPAHEYLICHADPPPPWYVLCQHDTNMPNHICDQWAKTLIGLGQDLLQQRSLQRNEN